MSERRLTIDGVEIHDGGACYVIAEVGHNHQGDLQQAKDLIGAEGTQTGHRRLVRALDPHRAREVDPDRLGRHRIVRIDAVLAQRPGGEHAVARTARLGDGLVEQAARHGRRQQAVH